MNLPCDGQPARHAKVECGGLSGLQNGTSVCGIRITVRVVWGHQHPHEIDASHESQYTGLLSVVRRLSMMSPGIAAVRALSRTRILAIS